MATAVLDVDLRRLPAKTFVSENYTAALVLLRWGSVPVGQIRLPVLAGRVHLRERADELLEAAAPALTGCWLRDLLESDPTPDRAAERVTVAVCTRDRPEDVRRCLEALAALPDDGQELLVVDNAPSSDATERVARAFPRVHYVREPLPGLDRARNRALREAAHDVVAFNDDDAVADRGWLRALTRNFRDPSVAAVTGLTMPLELETEAQECFERLSPFGRGFRRRVYDMEVLPPGAAGRAGAGANMALRSRIVRALGGFDEGLDAGTPTRAGGDNDMFARLLGAGYRIAYDPAALCWHRHRRTWVDLRTTMYGYGVGLSAFFARSVLVEGEWGTLAVAWRWLRHEPLPALLRALLRRPGHPPLDLMVAHLRGCLAGPRAYLASRRAAPAAG